MSRSRATTLALWLLVAALAVTGGLLLLPVEHSAPAAAPTGAPGPAPATASAVVTPARPRLDSPRPSPSTPRTRPAPPHTTSAVHPAAVTKTVAGHEPSAPSLPHGRRLGSAAAVRGYLQSRGSWSWRTERRDLAVAVARYVTPQFAGELRRRDPSIQWPLEWGLAHKTRGTRRLNVDSLSLNGGARNDAHRRFYVVRVTTILTDSQGQVLIRHRGRSLSIAVAHQDHSWKVFTDQPMG